MTMEDVAQQLMREFSKLRADVRDNAILVEQIADQNKAVLEAVGDIQRTVANLPTRDEFDELRRDVTTTMSAVRDMSGQVADHETRLSALEAA